MQDQLIGTTGQGCAAVADGQPRDTEVGPRGRLTWTVEYQPGLDQAVDARPAARRRPRRRRRRGCGCDSERRYHNV